MRINCHAWANARFARLTDWHSWFAWHPVTMPSGVCVWLEKIERKGHFSSGYGGDLWTYEYREPLRS